MERTETICKQFFQQVSESNLRALNVILNACLLGKGNKHLWILSHLLCWTSSSAATKKYKKERIIYIVSKSNLLPTTHSGTCAPNFPLVSRQFKYEQAIQQKTYLEILQFIILRQKLSLVLNLSVHILFVDNCRDYYSISSFINFRKIKSSNAMHKKHQL